MRRVPRAAVIGMFTVILLYVASYVAMLEGVVVEGSGKAWLPVYRMKGLGTFFRPANRVHRFLSQIEDNDGRD